MKKSKPNPNSMRSKKKLFYGIIILIIAVVLVNGYDRYFYKPWKFTEDRPVKILWLDSYHPELSWSQNQIQGFRDALAESILNYELKEFHMDTKRVPQAEFESRGQQARDLIESWQPDIVYASDDNAQSYVGIYYVDSNMPWVFSGVNADAAEYNYESSKVVAGILERQPFEETFELLNLIVHPAVKTVGTIVDDSVTGSLDLQMAIDFSKEVKDMEFKDWYVAKTFSEYKAKVKEYNEKYDAILLLAMHTLKDENGQSVPVNKVLEWTVENSQIPEVSLWDWAVDNGALLSVQSSSYQHGYLAGELVRQILVEGKRPGSLAMTPPEKGERSINLARAKLLDLGVPTSLLVKSRVVEKFPWEK